MHNPFTAVRKARIESRPKKIAPSMGVRLSIPTMGVSPPGIDPAEKRHLFEPFLSRRRVESTFPVNGLWRAAPRSKESCKAQTAA